MHNNDSEGVPLMNFVYCLAVALLVFSPVPLKCSTTRGVSPERRHLYSGPSFLCGDGTSIAIQNVNDYYCDCEDGTDEPGTSACSHVNAAEKEFYCPNEGHIAKWIFRSHVDDGVCDCCDGSDEQEGFCPRNCAALAAAQAAQEQQETDVRRQGLQQKRDLIERALQIRKERKIELEAAKERYTVKQRELEEFEMKKKEQEMLEDKEREALEESKKRNASVSGDWEHDAASFHEEYIHDLQDQISPDRHRRYRDKDDINIYDEIDDYGYDSKPKYERPEAKVAREIYQSQLREKWATQREVETLQRELGTPFGEQDAFLPLHGKCYFKIHKGLNHTLCMFHDVTQENPDRPDRGISLGRWTDFGEAGTAEEDEEYQRDFSTMWYEHGDSCWSGPMRHTVVRAVCGNTTEISDISEPSVCNYVITLRTPAICT